MASPILNLFDQMAANLSELREEVVKAIQPPSQLEVVKVANSIELEKAFADLAIRDGGIIRCRPGNEYFVNLTNPERALNAPWIQIVSDTEIHRPVGQMARREDIPGMAVIRAKDPLIHAFSCENRARNVAFTNVAFGPQAEDRTVVALGGSRTTLKTPDEMASGFLFDHVVWTGDSLRGQHRGLQPHAKDVKVIDCSMWDMFEYGRDSQGICAYNGCDGLVVENTSIEAGAENIMFGGGGSASAEMNPRNIVMRRIRLAKDRRWALLPALPNGVHFSIKNLLETKNVHNLLIDGMLLEQQYRWSWPQGWAMTLKVANQGGVEPWAECTDVLIRNVLVRDVGALMSVIAGHDSAEASRRMRNVRVENLLAIRMNEGEYRGTDQMVQMINTPDGLVLDHWTVLDNSHSILVGEHNQNDKMEPDTRPTTLALTNSIFREGEYNVKWTDTRISQGAIGKPALDMITGPGKWQFEGNILGKGVRSITGIPNNATVPLEDFVNAFDATGRMTFNARAAAEALVRTTDGKPVGADVDAIEVAAITK